jgi:glutathione S-transferase
MSLTFYYAPLSSATTTHWALEELGVPYEKVKIDLSKGEQKKPEYLAMNPNGKVPLLVHDGVPIFESVAILIHLGETFGVDKGLFPAAGPKRGEALKWLVWANVSLGESLSRFQHNTVDRIPREEHNAKAAERAKADVELHLGMLEKALEGRAYILGDAFSIVDAHLAGFVQYLGICGFDNARWPTLDAWAKKCAARPAHAKAWRPDA